MEKEESSTCSSILFDSEDIRGYMYFKTEDLRKEFKSKLKMETKDNQLIGNSPSRLLYQFIEEGSDELDIMEGNIAKIIFISTDSMNTQDKHAFALKYFQNLKTNKFGNILIHFKVISTTMDVAHDLNSLISDNLVIVTDTQTRGRGRANTKWNSQRGCAMFTYNMNFALDSALGKAPGFYGYLTSVAAVVAINANEDYSQLGVKIKWPNDIYSSSLQKIGGTLHDPVPTGLIVGIGVNIWNEGSFMCLHEIIDWYNSQNSTAIPHYSIELFVAQFMNAYEALFNEFQANEKSSLLKTYYSSWIHQDQHVIDAIGGSEIGAIIRGLDEKGSLLLEKKDTGEKYSHSPFGLAFDVINNTIRRKTDMPS